MNPLVFIRIFGVILMLAGIAAVLIATQVLNLSAPLEALIVGLCAGNALATAARYIGTGK